MKDMLEKMAAVMQKNIEETNSMKVETRSRSCHER